MIVPVGFGEVTARINLTGDPEEMNVVFGFEVESAPWSQSKTDTLSGTIATYFKPLLASTATFQGIRCKIGNDGGPLLFESVSGAGVGTSSTNCLPQNCAWLVRKSTGLGGRANMGRMFIPGVPEAATNNAGVIDSTALTSAQTGMNSFLSELDTEGSRMVLLHSSSLNTPDTVVALIVDDVIATQRRRLR